MPSSDVSEFRLALASARSVMVVSGAGLSVASGKLTVLLSSRHTSQEVRVGVPTFRGKGGRWRKYDAASVGTLNAWNESQSRVWQYFHYRREEYVLFSSLFRLSLNSHPERVKPHLTTGTVFSPVWRSQAYARLWRPNRISCTSLRTQTGSAALPSPSSPANHPMGPSSKCTATYST